jgi:uncharacterized RDD family membrane protein YckC
MSTAPDAQYGSIGLELSSLSTYAGTPGAIPGVGFWPRAAARVIDFLLHIFLSSVIGFTVGLALAIASAGQPNPLLVARLRQNTMLGFILAILGSVAYEAVCEGFHGSTFGKRILSMVVVQEDGSPCRFVPALIRSFAYLVDSLFFGLVGYLAMQKTPQEQRHGDEWAHTVVCKRADAPSQSLGGNGRFLVVLFLALVTDGAFILFALAIKLNA